MDWSLIFMWVGGLGVGVGVGWVWGWFAGRTSLRCETRP